ncbi:MAG: hypothetical protein K0Q74_1201 [Gammaproteobacteria bacterium]|nr:hypothetical protein [Gammaproteobacteria bacterium]
MLFYKLLSKIRHSYHSKMQLSSHDTRKRKVITLINCYNILLRLLIMTLGIFAKRSRLCEKLLRWKWWRRGGSNSRPRHCERRALPAELRPHKTIEILTRRHHSSTYKLHQQKRLNHYINSLAVSPNSLSSQTSLCIPKKDPENRQKKSQHS